MRCIACNRILTREPGLSQGIGPTCAKKRGLAAEFKQDPGDTDTIVPYDGGDLWVIRTEPDRATVSPLRTNVQRSKYHHSPTGFKFGYGGSGPADLALNICRMFAAAPDEVGPAVYQEFKRRYTAGHDEGDESRLTIPKAHVLAFLAEHGVKTKEAPAPVQAELPNLTGLLPKAPPPVIKTYA